MALFLSVLEVFDDLFPNKVKSTLGVNVYYFTLGNFKLSKFQEQEIKKKRFNIVRNKER
ncbi:MAG: hypothetical protein LBU83_01475 [Bacteroidales bacterium]|nr:hypothetical protein [Bacteroidales bacterium]